MKDILNITSGDIAGTILEESGIGGDVFVWHDILYDGPRTAPGWPDEETLESRAGFLSETTDGGLDKDLVLNTLKNQYIKLSDAGSREKIILWFDACLFDQSMLCHILACLAEKGLTSSIELICVDSFPGIEPFHGLGQLSPEQMASLLESRKLVTDDQFNFAKSVDRAFALQDMKLFTELSEMKDVPLPWAPAAIKRWMEETPDPGTGFGRLENSILQALSKGCETPGEIFKYVSRAETPPQYWGDITLWEKINGLADRNPPLLNIMGPRERLPQWESSLDMDEFTISSN